MGIRHMVADHARLEVLVDNRFSVGEKLWPVAFGVTGGQLNGVAAVAVHAPNLQDARAI